MYRFKVFLPLSQYSCSGTALQQFHRVYQYATVLFPTTDTNTLDLFNRHSSMAADLHCGTRDEEPLIDAAVNRSRQQVLTPGDAIELALVHPVGGVGVGDVGKADISILRLSGDQLVPRIGALADNVQGVPVER